MAERLANFIKEMRLIYYVLFTFYLFASVHNTFAQCTASVGTFTLTSNGFISQGVLTLAFGDQATINSNNNWTPPPQGSNTTIQYNPDIIWLIYSCPPSIALTPDPNVFITSDPCLKSVINARNLIVNGTLSLINAYPAGTFSQNIVYLVPITAYNRAVDPIIVTLTNPRCYQMGTPVPVQFLPDVSINQTQNCTAGTVTATLSGGLPSLDGSPFSVVTASLTPTTASFVNTTASNNGTITISGLKNGDVYSYEVRDNKGSSKLVTGTFVGLASTSISYSKSSFCQSESNPSPTLSGSTGGVYSSTSGLSINSTSGIVNLASSTPGTYTVTYAPTAGACQSPSTSSITIYALPSINAGTDQSICSGQSITLTATGGSTYLWDNNITNGEIFTPSISGTYTVTGTDANNCQNTDQVQVTVYALPTLDAGTDQTVCLGASITLAGSGASTYSWDNGVSNNVPFNIANTTTYTLTGTDANGCSSTDQVQITVASALNVSAGADQTICAGETVTLSASGAVSYSWDKNVMNGVAFTPNNSGTYTVTGTDANNCQSTDQVQVTINALPTVDAGIDQTICSGQSVTLTATGALNYAWNNGISNGVAFTPASSNAYTVTGTASNGCQSTDIVQVKVNPNPTVNAGQDQTVCAGAPVTLTGSGATSYSWNNGITNNVPFTATTSTTYTLTGADQAGCTASDQVQITVTPAININAGNDLSVCTGQSVTLTATGAVNYSWDNNVTNGVAFTPNSSATYTVTGTDANNCQGTDQVQVTVNTLPNVSAGADQTICEGKTVTLTANGAVNYSWDKNVTNGVAFVPSASGVYTVTGTDANNCQNTDQVSVTLNPNIPVQFTADAVNGCIPFTATFTHSVPGASICTWTFGDGSTTTGCSGVSHTFEEIGCFDVTLSVETEQTCVSSFTKEELICVENAPSAAFNPSSFTVTEFNNTIQFTNESKHANTYLWDFGDESTSSNLENPSHKYTIDGKASNWIVSLVAQTSLGCKDSAFTTIHFEEDLVFYIPNSFTPNDDMFNQRFQPVFSSGYDPSEFNMKIYNRWGQIIFETNNTDYGWDGSFGSKAEIDKVAEGIYSWKIEFKLAKNDERRVVVGSVNLIR